MQWFIGLLLWFSTLFAGTTIHMERETIINFLENIGIRVIPTELDDDCFLPGLKLDKDTILMDTSRMKYPGDLLHEAGHLAVTPAEQRQYIGTAEMDPEWPTAGDELAAILWSYGALHFLNLPPELVFHPNGYKDESEWLIQSFEAGNYIGLPLLEWMGLCHGPERAKQEATSPFPQMIKWLR